MANQNKISVKNLYWFNPRIYELFETLVHGELDCEPEERLEILNKFFITYKYPKLKDFGYNIETHEGEEGPNKAAYFIAYSYELFLKETDVELYKIFQTAQNIWCDQFQIMPILQKAQEHPKMVEPITQEDGLSF